MIVKELIAQLQEFDELDENLPITWYGDGFYREVQSIIRIWVTSWDGGLYRYSSPDDKDSQIVLVIQ